MAAPAWVVPQQWKPLKPPADVMALGKVRSGANLLAATNALCVKEAARYAATAVTWCNIYFADALDILGAPIPHMFDPDGDGPLPSEELRANRIVELLRAKKFDGYYKVDSNPLILANRAACGLPTVAVWFNKSGPGHVVLIVPTPTGKSGVYVTGAGRNNLQQEPIAKAFGSFLPNVEFFGHD